MSVIELDNENENLENENDVEMTSPTFAMENNKKVEVVKKPAVEGQSLAERQKLRSELVARNLKSFEAAYEFDDDL